MCPGLFNVFFLAQGLVIFLTTTAIVRGLAVTNVYHGPMFQGLVAVGAAHFSLSSVGLVTMGVAHTSFGTFFY